MEEFLIAISWILDTTSGGYISMSNPMHLSLLCWFCFSEWK